MAKSKKLEEWKSYEHKNYYDNYCIFLIEDKSFEWNTISLYGGDGKAVITFANFAKDIGTQSVTIITSEETSRIVSNGKINMDGEDFFQIAEIASNLPLCNYIELLMTKEK